jgi:hypothetical protein
VIKDRWDRYADVVLAKRPGHVREILHLEEEAHQCASESSNKIRKPPVLLARSG